MTTSALPIQPLLDPRAAADFLGVSARTLEGWRLRDGGPRYLRLTERTIRYWLPDLADWLSTRCFATTSEASVAEAAV